MSSLQTKIAAIASMVAAIAGAVVLYMDGDPMTNPDWNLLIALIITNIGVFTARQNTVSSEEVLAKRIAK